MAKRIQQESGEERVTAKSRPVMNLTARMPSIVSSSTSSNPVKTWHGYQNPKKSVVVDDRSGEPDRLSPTGYSKSDYDRSWSSQEWKSEVTAHDLSGKPDKTSWNAVQQICPYHGDALLDGNAQSVRYGEIIHDGSGQLDSANSQEEADSETSVMGSDAAEFVNKVKDQVRSRQKRMSNVADSGEEHSIIWRKKSLFGNNCHWLVTKPLSIFYAQKSTSSQILCCVLERFIHIRNPTKLGRKG